jgi:hypothetical protein
MEDVDHEWLASGWTRPASGGLYQWVDGSPAKLAGAQCASDRRWLYSTIATAAERISYHPMVDEPALFRAFADAEPTEDGFLKFVNRYGQLGTRELASVGNNVFTAESLTRFLSEHEAVTQVVGMIDALRRGRGIEAHTRTISHPLIDQALKSGDFRQLKDACLKWLEATINNRLSGWTDNGDAVVTLLRRNASGRLRLQQVTRSLVGIIWLQCARAAEGDQVFRRCKSCRGWMLISPDFGKRRQTIYCSPVCKVREFRKEDRRRRRKRAVGKQKRGTR